MPSFVADISNDNLALFFALGSTLTFSGSSLLYAEYSRRISVLWMNSFKSLVAFVALLVTIPIFWGWHEISLGSLAAFFTSGLIGLNIGDLFLLSAFTRIGAVRTLILFGFQPIMTGALAYFFLGQTFDPHKLIAVFFMICCLFVFSLEKFRQSRQWEIHGLVYALLGVGLDSCGVMLSRIGFDQSPLVVPAEGHLYRCVGALIGFGVISFFRPIGLKEHFLRFQARDRGLMIMASLGGTYLALMLYLSAVRIGHLASIAGIGITGPMFATLLESLVHRRAPSRYLYIAFAFFLGGFYILWSVS